MKLPDFAKFQPFVELRQRMGADRLGGFTLGYEWERLTSEDLKRLRTEGIEVPPEAIAVQKDGTLSYKDSRVIVYIRDVTAYRDKPPKLPKFHVSDCDTLQEMKARKRFEARYVVATKTDGEFLVNIKDRFTSTFVKQWKRLDICKNCLRTLDYDGAATISKLRTAFDNFSLEEFFNRYPRSLIKQRPRHTDRTAPLNEYAANAEEISKEVRNRARYKCKVCQIDLSAVELRRYLHVHHRNGQKSDNRPSNLLSLCLKCHSEQPNHEHLKATPDYYKFLRILRHKRGVMRVR